MWFFYQKALKLSEHYGRTFEGLKDLIVTRSGRTGSDERDVRPNQLGKTPDGRGRRWGIQTLKTKGRKAAINAGHNRPSDKQIIEYGLWEAAKKNPLELKKESETLRIIRLALFDRKPVFSVPPGIEREEYEAKIPQLQEWIWTEALKAME